MKTDDAHITTPELLLQEELHDLRTLSLQADHLRWVTRGPEAQGFDTLVSNFTTQWRTWSDQVARRIVQSGLVPEGRASAVCEIPRMSWLPGDWLDVSAASEWIEHELRTLSSWTSAREELAEGEDFDGLLSELERGLEDELQLLEDWQSRNGLRIDVVDEAGIESFPASDSPAY